MSFKTVKSLSIRAPQGQRHARELDRIGAPYLKRHNGDGSTSYKKGGVLMERSAPPTEEALGDGYYVLGRVGSEFRIMGSRTIRGKFKDRGPSGGGSFSRPVIQFYGGGKGFDIETEVDSVGFPNVDGKVYPFVYTSVYTTKTGKDSELRHTFVDVNIAGGSPPRLHPQLSSPFFGWSGTVLKGGEHVRRIYFVGLQVVDGEHQPKLYADPTKAGGDVVALPTLYIPGQLCMAPTVHPVDTRGKLLLLNRYLRPTYANTSVDVGACPGLFFTSSGDHGETWTEVLDKGILSDAASLAFLPIDNNANYSKPFAYKHNEAVYATNLQLFCTDPAQSRGIAMAVVPDAQFVGGQWVIKYRRRIGTYDGFTSVSNVMHFEGQNSDECFISADSPTPYVLNGVQGVLFLDRSAPSQALIPSTRPTLKWTDGSSVTTLGLLPYTNNVTGSLAAVSKTGIVCMMYDGEFSLYQLNDGMTWDKRATVYAGPNAALPAPTHWTLQNFSRLTFLRRDGAPVSATPSAPWATDSRKLPPP